MTTHRTDNSYAVPLGEAALMLGLPTDAVTSLADAGFLARLDGALFARSDLKAFIARNADNGSGNLFLTEGGVDASDLLLALQSRTGDMADRSLEIFSDVFPDARDWGRDERDDFLDQATSRFNAILTVASLGANVDQTLIDELEAIGASAALDGSPLPQLLVVLRISRDLVVQTAIEIADERGRHWSLPLALLLTRVLPAMDRLTDSLAAGYWSAHPR